MKFFVPQTPAADYQVTYEAIAKSVKEQMRMPIIERKVFSIRYAHDKKKWHAQVGELDPQQGRYEVLAIFESKPYVVFTRAADGGQGVTILVGNDEITHVEDFE